MTNERLWKQYHLKQKAKEEKASQAAEETIFNAPPLPDIDAEWLYWEMMRISRAPDPHMFPALKRLRQQADKSKDGDEAFLIGALSNTSIFPADHEFSRQDTPEGMFNRELRALFDVFVSSAHVGMRKPDVDIYEHAIKQLDELARKRGLFGGDGVKAGDIVFLDDIGGNLRTAKKVGMRTIKVNLGRADMAVNELERVMSLNLASTSSKL